MKKINLIILLLCICAISYAQNFTDSFYRNNQWYYTMQPNTGYVKYFYPKEKYTIAVITRIYELYPELLNKLKEDTTQNRPPLHFTTSTSSLLWESTRSISYPLIWHHDTPEKDYQQTHSVATYSSSTPVLHIFKIIYSYTLIGENKTGTKTIKSYHYPTFQDVLSKAKIPKQVAISDLYISLSEE